MRNRLAERVAGSGRGACRASRSAATDPPAARGASDLEPALRPRTARRRPGARFSASGPRRGPLRERPARLQQQDPVGELRREVDLVRDEEHRRPRARRGSARGVSRNSRRCRGSSPAVGSSSSQTSASCASARARKTRRCSPPESAEASRSASSSTSQARIASSARSPVRRRVGGEARGRAARVPGGRGRGSGSGRRDRRSAGRRRCGARSRAAAIGVERPSVEQELSPGGGTTRAMTFSNVDLPEPFSPRTRDDLAARDRRRRVRRAPGRPVRAP